jgi:DNA processing protein
VAKNRALERKAVQLSDQQRRAWLRLARTDNVGPVTFRNLIARFGSATAALEELPRLAQRVGSKIFVLPPEEESLRELEAVAKLGGRLIAVCESELPPGLKALDAPGDRLGPCAGYRCGRP